MNEKIMNLLKICISGIASLIFLSVFSIFINYTGAHIANPNGATDYTWEPGQLLTTVLEGFAFLRMDSNGFNNVEVTPKQETDILLMGSSHVEAVQVGPDENMGSQLNRLLPELHTYNIGISGHMIYTCVKNMERAVSVYHPGRYVLLETNTVEADPQSMQDVLDGEYMTQVSYDSGLVYQISKKLPGVKLLYKKIADWARSSPVFGEAQPEIPEADYSSPDYKSLLDRFLNMAAKPVREAGARLIIFYHPAVELSGGGYLRDGTDITALSAFEKACKENGIIFVNSAEDFKRMYKEEHRLPYGFANTAVGKGHLNKYGHRVIAGRLAQVIRSLD